MEFQVPQFIDVEDKVIGPLTLKQAGIIGLGGVILLLLWFTVKMSTFIILALIIGPLTLFVAFKKIYGRSVPSFLVGWFNYQIKPKLFIWKDKN